MARQTAIKSNQKLQDEEMESIVNQLFQCEDSQYSPIGKKIIQVFPKEMISKWFE